MKTLLLLVLLPFALALNMTGPITIDLPINMWSLAGERIYVASNNTIIIMNTSGAVIEKVSYNEVITGISATETAFVTLTANNMMFIMTAESCYQTALQPPVDGYGLITLENYIALISLASYDPHTQTLVDFYFYNGTFVNRVTLPYVALSYNIYGSGAIITTNEFYPTDETLVMIAYVNGTVVITRLQKHINILSVTKHLGELYCSSVGIYVFMENGDFLGKYKEDVFIDSQIYFYEEHMIYMSFNDTDVTLYFRVGKRAETVSIPYQMAPRYYIGLAVSPSGKLVTSIPNQLLIFTL